MLIRQLANGYYAGRLSGQWAEIVLPTRMQVIEILLKLKQYQNETK